jgi:alpha-methylacyl-CoA racemase
MEGGDVCFAPVLSLEESINYKHNKERETFVDIDGVIQPAPAPRFSNTPGEIKHSPVKKGENTREILKNIGKENLIEELLNSNIISEG